MLCSKTELSLISPVITKILKFVVGTPSPSFHKQTAGYLQIIQNWMLLWQHSNFIFKAVLLVKHLVSHNLTYTSLGVKPKSIFKS